MDTETKQEDVTTPAPQASEKPAEQTVEQLQAKYEGEIERLKKEAAGSTKASQKWQQRAERIEALEAKLGKLDKIEAMLSSFANVALPDDETRQTYEKKVKDSEPKVDETLKGYEAAIDAIFADEEVTWDDLPSEDQKQARELWQAGKLDAATRSLKKSLNKVKKVQADKQKEEEEADKKEREDMANKMVTDRKGSTGSPSRRSFTRAEIDKMSQEEFTKNEADIMAALRAGNIR